MTSALGPELIKPVLTAYRDGNRTEAMRLYAQILLILNIENRRCGFRAAKAAMLKGGVIQSDFCRHPIAPLHPDTRYQLMELLQWAGPLVLNCNN